MLERLLVLAVLVTLVAGTDTGHAQYQREPIAMSERPTETGGPDNGAPSQSRNDGGRQDIACDDKCEREKSDLQAQQGMADAAWWMVYISIASLVLTICGFGLLIGTLLYTRDTAESSRKMAKASEEASNTANIQVQLSRHALVDTDRAFVYPADTTWYHLQDARSKKTESYRMAIKWTNSGKTPTQFLNIRFNRSIRDDLPPEDFDFPDYGPPEQIITFIAPNGTLESAPLDLTLDEMTAIRDGKSHLYAWGWAEYDDVFDRTGRHRTEFCHKWAISGDIANDEISKMYVIHNRYNGADSECLKPLQTGSPKSPLLPP